MMTKFWQDSAHEYATQRYYHLAAACIHAAILWGKREGLNPRLPKIPDVAYSLPTDINT